jgi:hypothetical protein
MFKKLYADNTAFIIPGEAVMFLAIVACVASIGWAIIGNSLDIHVMPATKVDIVQPQADMAVNNASAVFRSNERVDGDGQVIEYVDVFGRKQRAEQDEYDSGSIENINICGR